VAFCARSEAQGETAVADVEMALVGAVVTGCAQKDGDVGICANSTKSSATSAYARGAVIYVPFWMAQYLLDTIVMLKRGFGLTGSRLLYTLRVCRHGDIRPRLLPSFQGFLLSDRISIVS
jgi:hypothetical protein